MRVLAKPVYKSRHSATLFWLIGLFLLSDNISCAASQKGPAHKFQRGWVISQSSNFAGTVFSELTTNALRMKVGKLGLIFITRAPDWNAYVFNVNTKNFVELPYKDWQKRLVMTQGSKLRDQRGQIKLESHMTGRSTNICQFRAEEYWVERKGDPKLGIAPQRITDLWIASEIKAPPQIAQVFCSQLNVPAAKGIPLKALHLTNGKMVSVLETLDVQRKALSMAMFEPIKNYRRVKDELGLMMSESTEDMVNDLLNSTAPSSDMKPVKRP